MIEAEKAVIACLLIDNQSMADVYGLLEPSMFADPYYSKIYSVIRQCYDEGSLADVITIPARIGGDEHAKEVILSRLRDAVLMDVLSMEIASYARAVLREYKAREIRRIIGNAETDPAQIEGQIVMLSDAIEALRGAEGSRSYTAAEAVKEFSADMFTSKRSQGISLGHEELDSLLGGLDGGDMVIIAARPSVGKSALVTEMAIHMAKQGRRVGLYSLEMSNRQVYERMIAHESGISISRIRRAQSFVGEEWRLFDAGNEAIRGMQIFLCDNLRAMSGMRGDMRRNRLDVAIIDYAQLIQPDTRYAGNRTAEVGQISHDVKWTAKKLGIPIILLAQLNRVSMMTKDNEPTMAELRESGDFEQDADKIILLWNKDRNRSVKCVKVDKNREGESGRLTMLFDGATMRFSEVDGFEAAGDSPFELDD